MSNLIENGRLPAAALSPRISGGVIKWYEGDTFALQIDMELLDQDGASIMIQSTDTVEVAFFNKKRNLVKKFIFTAVENNSVLLVFDEETTALFPAGEYTYDIYYDGFERKTLAKDGVAIVE